MVYRLIAGRKNRPDLVPFKADKERGFSQRPDPMIKINLLEILRAAGKVIKRDLELLGKQPLMGINFSMLFLLNLPATSGKALRIRSLCT